MGDIRQHGERQASSILQIGTGHVARIDQRGADNQATIEQHGQSHNAAVSQIGNDNQYSLFQQGHNLIGPTVTQIGGVAMNIVQTGG